MNNFKMSNWETLANEFKTTRDRMKQYDTERIFEKKQEIENHAYQRVDSVMNWNDWNSLIGSKHPIKTVKISSTEPHGDKLCTMLSQLSGYHLRRKYVGFDFTYEDLISSSDNTTKCQVVVSPKAINYKTKY